MTSLRARLWTGGIAGVAVAALLAAWLLGAGFERAAQRTLDHRLQDDFASVVALLQVLPDGAIGLRREPFDERYARVFSGWYWRVEDGPAVLQSRSLWDGGILLEEGAEETGAGARRGFATGPRGERLRVFEQDVRLPRAERPVRVAVAAGLDATERAVREFRLLAAAAVAAIAAALLLALAAQVAWSLRPFRRIGRTLARVRRGERARFDAQALPAEVAPLAAEIDALLDEHERRVARARSAAQDLAHALKTPLAVIETELQRGAVPEAVRSETARIRAIVERYTAVGAGVDPRARSPVAPVAEAVAALMRRVHAARGLDLQVDVPGELVFAGSREDLEELLGNLLDNACKWARSAVRVRAGSDGARLWIEVADDGPGLADADLQRVRRRGVRLDERVPGTGHGLAIVEAVVESYGGAFELEPGSPGLRARLLLPSGG
ncbi:ATP-binding protein [Coralloluteibacterium thermophilus]|uniref:histidine kinase n=1 Tax=Coralloluteibacterium thermophilum TaxID=2707049 RepID=A0ABV9NFY4_9GAMM